MRVLGLIPLLIVAACGSEGGSVAEKNEAAPKAAAPEPGQWELATEVTSFRAVDEGEPKISAAVGTRATESVCVGAGGQLPPALFAGDGYDCSYGTYYVRNGRLNVTMDCRREGLAGMIAITAEGQSQGETAEYTRNVRTSLSTDGDVEISTRVTGRRTGECAAGGESGNQSEGRAG